MCVMSFDLFAISLEPDGSESPALACIEAHDIPVPLMCDSTFSVEGRRVEVVGSTAQWANFMKEEGAVVMTRDEFLLVLADEYHYVF